MAVLASEPLPARCAVSGPAASAECWDSRHFLRLLFSTRSFTGAMEGSTRENWAPLRQR